VLYLSSVQCTYNRKFITDNRMYHVGASFQKPSIIRGFWNRYAPKSVRCSTNAYIGIVENASLVGGANTVQVTTPSAPLPRLRIDRYEIYRPNFIKLHSNMHTSSYQVTPVRYSRRYKLTTVGTRPWYIASAIASQARNTINAIITSCRNHL
jgi:hypothetical protein